MPGNPRAKRIRDRIMRNRGLATTTEKGTRRPRPLPTIPPFHKTWAMQAVELKYGLPLAEILTSGSLRYIERKFGIDHCTAGIWRQKLGIKGSEVSTRTLRDA